MIRGNVTQGIYETNYLSLDYVFQWTTHHYVTYQRGPIIQL